jgi:aminomethyltransferase
MAAKKTPIYDSHVEQGGRIVEFAGYLMPVSFEGIVAEHQRVRTKVGLFDVSHMGEIDIKGDGAAAFTDSLVTNSVQTLEEGQICYAVACNERGRALDDLLVYKFSDSRILLVVNAVNADKIFEHVVSLAPSSIEVTDSTQGIGQIAVQGPASKKLLLGSGFCSTVTELVERMSYYHFVSFEKSGSEIRDTLRFEPSFCLYGNELDEEISPLEAGLSWLVKLKKDRFIGRDSFLMEKERGPERKLVGLELEGRSIARHGYKVMLDGAEIGAVTSGTFAPTLKKSLAMALVSRSVPKDAGGFSIDVRGRSVPASLAGLPFYRSRAGD